MTAHEINETVRNHFGPRTWVSIICTWEDGSREFIAAHPAHSFIGERITKLKRLNEKAGLSGRYSVRRATQDEIEE